MNITIHSDWQTFLDSLIFSTQAKPSATGFYLILCDGSLPITSTTPKNTIISQELSDDGYVRKQLTSGNVTNVSGDLIRSFPEITHQFTATKSYKYIVMLANATSSPGDTNGIVVGFADEGSDQLIIANQELDLNVSYIIDSEG